MVSAGRSICNRILTRFEESYPCGMILVLSRAHPRGLVFRSTFDAAGIDAAQTFMASSPRWHIVGRWRDIVHEVSRHAAGNGEGMATVMWHANMSAAVLRALRMASRLLGKGAESTIAPGGLSDITRLTDQAVGTLQNLEKRTAEEAARQTLEAFFAVGMKEDAGASHRSDWLAFHGGAGGEWMVSRISSLDHKLLWRVSAGQFAVTAAAHFKEDPPTQMELFSGPQSLADEMRAVIKAAAPRVLEAMEVARTNMRRALIHLGQYVDQRRVRNDVWLEIVPSAQGAGGRGGSPVELSVTRPHREFVIQSSAGRLYYMPPCLLKVPLACARDCLSAHLPRVRVPATTGYRFLHPYTGQLEPQPDVLVLNKEELPCRSSMEDAFTALQARPSVAKERDMCLEAQIPVLEEVNAGLRSLAVQECQPDELRACIEPLFHLIRSGLTTGHQQNTSTPRMDFSSLPYPLRKSPKRDDPLAARVFTFSGSRLYQTVA